MVRKCIILVAFTVLLVFSCDNKQNSKGVVTGPGVRPLQPSVAEKNIQRVDEFFSDPFLDGAVRLPPVTSVSFKDIETAMGPIVQSREEKVPNQYDTTITDKRIILTSEHYTVGYYYSELKKEYMLEFFAIDNPKIPLKFDVSLGVKEEDIIKIFGKNDTKIQGKDSFVLVYFTSQSGQINFTIKNGTLSEIGFTHTV